MAPGPESGNGTLAMMGRKNKKESARPAPPSPPPSQATPPPAPPRLVPDTPRRRPSEGQPPTGSRGRGSSFANIGRSVHVKGELTGNEDLTVDGTVEGRVDLNGHNLTIGTHGRITAEVSAKRVVVRGHVTGDILAEERIEVADGGVVEGDLTAPKVVLAEGARFKGSVDMLTGTPPAGEPTWQEPEPSSAFSEAEAPPAFGEEPGSDQPPEPPAPLTDGGDERGEQDEKDEQDETDSGGKELADMFGGFDPTNP